MTIACNYFPPLKLNKTEGIDVEIINLALKNLSYEIKFIPWIRALYETENGKVDALCSCSKTKAREKNLLFSDSIGHVDVGYFSLDNNGLNSNKTNKVGVVRGYNLTDELKLDQKSITLGNSEEILLRMLKAKRIDKIYSFKNPLLFANKKLGLKLKYFSVRNSPYYFCISKKSKIGDKLLKEFNDNFRKLEKTNIIKKIKNKYLNQ